MFDLDSFKLKPFEVHFKGHEYTFETLTLGYKLQECMEEKDPEKIRQVVVKATGLTEIDAFQASAFLKTFYEFLESQEESLKKVFGRGLTSSTTTT